MKNLYRSILIMLLILVLGNCTVQKRQAYRSIFNGFNLNGWDGDPAYWRVDNGTIVGEVTPTTLLKRNTFLIWRGGRPADFELKLEYRISAKGNSGINYRSAEMDTLRFALKEMP